MAGNKRLLKIDGVNSEIAVERLTALWALNECGLGGLMHAFRLPFTGILVGGISVLLITLIALYANNIWSTLIKALTIVLLFKAGVSPYTPLPAYFAVSFQAFLGIVLFSFCSVKKWVIIVLCAITFLESMLQKIVTSTIVFGNSLWDSLEVYIEWIGNQLSFLPFTLNSRTLIFSFLGIYFCSGIVVGFLIIRTIKLMQEVSVFEIDLDLKTVSPKLRSTKKSKKGVYFFIVLLIVVLLPILFFNEKSQALQQTIYLILRSGIILIIWYTFLSPLILRLLNKFLSLKQKFYKTDFEAIFQIFPFLQAIVYHSWNYSKMYKGFKRLTYFLAASIVQSLSLTLKDRY